MPNRLENGVIYYRAKGDAAGAVIVGAILIAFAGMVHTREGIGGIPFSADLTAMATYLALPLGIVLMLANFRHLFARGATLAADDTGLSILYTKRPLGLIPWTAINGFSTFSHQGKWYLGITLEDPEITLEPFRGNLTPVIGRFGPKEAHLRIHEKMLDEDIDIVHAELEEMRHIRSWRG